MLAIFSKHTEASGYKNILTKPFRNFRYVQISKLGVKEQEQNCSSAFCKFQKNVVLKNIGIYFIGKHTEAGLGKKLGLGVRQFTFYHQLAP